MLGEFHEGWWPQGACVCPDAPYVRLTATIQRKRLAEGKPGLASTAAGFLV